MTEDKQNYVPYRASKKQDFCLNAGLKVLRFKAEMREKRSAEASKPKKERANATVL